MLEEMVNKVIKKAIAVDYPHLKLPSIVFAKVESVKKLDTHEVKELVIFNDDTGGSFRAHIAAYWYEYTLCVLDRFKSPDPRFPVLPQIRSKKQFQQGAVVVIALPYGELEPEIIGEVKM